MDTKAIKTFSETLDIEAGKLAELAEQYANMAENVEAYSADERSLFLATSNRVWSQAHKLLDAIAIIEERI
jgi:hypothetical protein